MQNVNSMTRAAYASAVCYFVMQAAGRVTERI